MRAATVVQQLCKSCRTCFMFYCVFYFTYDRSFTADIAACRDTRADIAFVLDASGSIVEKDHTNWNLMKAFVITLIRSLRVSQNDTRVALVRFSMKASVIFHLDSYFDVEQAVQVTFTSVSQWHTHETDRLWHSVKYSCSYWIHCAPL